MKFCRLKRGPTGTEIFVFLVVCQGRVNLSVKYQFIGISKMVLRKKKIRSMDYIAASRAAFIGTLMHFFSM